MFRRAEMDTRENAGRTDPHPTGASVEADSGDGKAPIEPFEPKPGEGYWLVEGRHRASSWVGWVDFRPSCGKGWEWTSCAGATRFRTRETAEAAIRLLRAAVPTKAPPGRLRLTAVYDFSATEHVDVLPAAAAEHVRGAEDPTCQYGGISRIAAERAKQIKSFSSAYDDGHLHGELLEAAQQLLTAVQDDLVRTPAGIADFGLAERHPDAIDRLVIAGALIAAEIDRRLRQRRWEVLARDCPLSEQGLRQELARLSAEFDLLGKTEGQRRRELLVAISRYTEELQRVTGKRDPADTSEAEAAAAPVEVTVCQGCGEAEAVRRTADDVPLCGECFEEVAAATPNPALQGELVQQRARLVLGDQVGLELYLVQDDDRPLYVVARSFADAIARWQLVIRGENGDDLTEDPQPQGVQRICRPDELLVPRLARKEGGNG